ncbi:AbrB/MazE/SpoVT family DNA-binding domain-containing protein [Beijerinckia sp. L45]|uniref:AbrB/MazE/SpoVT family DNA-binding domain-containing protein n=1 Tax=Beijerinckia sp. L45 TaxID=1641855 RepID=UPI00131CA079|nr:AbrB/MazE/SpoVT family DNA-binding domain-containing protein [Beijerinckia sp. L45]
MRITADGQVTIPAELLEQAGLLPNTDIDLVFDGKDIRIKRVEPQMTGERDIVAHLRGRGDVAISTDAVMALTRGD